MLWLGEDDVEALLDPKALVAAIEDGFRHLGEAGTVEPEATRIDGLAEGTSYLTAFPCYRAASGLATAKVLAGRRDNPAFGRPEIDAVVVLADAATAEIAAIVSARMLTALRTAATTAVAVRQCRSRAGAPVVALIGTGVQGRAHARVLAAAGLAERFLVAAPGGGMPRAAVFADQVARLTGLPAAPATVKEAAAEAEIVVTATLSGTPLVGRGETSRTGILACVGPFYPGETEIDPALCRAASMLVSDHPDRLRRQWQNGPDVLPEHVIALADLVRGNPCAPASGLALFLSDGRAFEDNVAAGLVLEAALRTGRGVKLR